VAEGRAGRATSLELVSAVAHDLKPPIAAVRGAVSALRERRELDAATRDRLLAVIADSADQLGLLVDDLLAAGQLESGRLQVDLCACDAAELVAAVLEGARASAPASLRLTRTVARSLPAVHADPTRLRQVLANLVDNAVRHAGPAGSVEVSLGAREDTVLITVCDDGPGVAPEDLERIFERHERGYAAAHGSGYAAAQGSGLGLYLARGLTEAMGGTLRVESEPGQRTTFAVELATAGADPLTDRDGTPPD